jgi:osmotically-inducible protein OsmY
MEHDHQYLVGRLQEVFATDPRVNALDLRVMMRGGKVHITGQVPTEERRRAVEEVVAEVLPEVQCCNELTVYELHPVTPPEVIHA